MTAATGHSKKVDFYEHKDDFPLKALTLHPVWVKTV